MKTSLRTKINAGFAAALLIIVVIAAFSYYSTLALLDTVDEEQRAHVVIESLNAVLADLNAGEGAQRGYLLTTDASHLRRYRASVGAVRRELDRLAAETEGRSVAPMVAQLRIMVERRLAEFEERRRLRDEAGLDAAVRAIRADIDDPQIYAQANRIEHTVRGELVAEQKSVNQLARLTLSIIALGAVTAMVLLIVAGVVIHHEVSQRTRAYRDLETREFQLNDFLENAVELIQAVDVEGRFMYVNQAWRNTLGYGDAVLPALRLSDIVAPSRRDATLASFRSAAQTRAQEQLETVFLTSSGAEVIVEGNISGQGEGDNVVTRGLFRDVTEARAVERLKDEFVSVVSHELRTPLTSIRGALGLIATGRLGELNDKGKRMVQIAVADSERLVRLINDILDIERMEAGRLEMQKTTCELGQLLRRATDGVQPLAERADVRIEVAGSTGNVWCDSDRILQTLTNLLGNAIKFSPAGGTVWLATTRDDRTITFSVRDEGRGIPAEKLDTIFERFQQVDASDARQKGGAGLGLAIARSIVLQHGGQIWAESDGKSGSTFRFTLPAYAVRAGEPVGPVGAPLIIIAEDDLPTAETLQSILLDNGFRAVHASTGKHTVELAEQHAPAAILLDIAMPEMDGWEALRLLKSNRDTAGIPVIIETGTEQNAQRLGDERIREWLQKPLRETDVIAALQRALEAPDDNTAVILTDWPKR